MRIDRIGPMFAEPGAMQDSYVMQNTGGSHDTPVTGRAAGQAGAGGGASRPVLGKNELERAVGIANENLEGHNRKIEISVHKKTGDIMVKVLDADTNEVIREIPPEKIADMIANMLEQAGLLADERA